MLQTGRFRKFRTGLRWVVASPLFLHKIQYLRRHRPVIFNILGIFVFFTLSTLVVCLLWIILHLLVKHVSHTVGDVVHYLDHPVV